MSNAWDPMVQPLLELLKSSVQDLVDTGKQEVQDFLKNQAEQYAKQTWISVNASSDDEKAEALDNLRHLKAQVIMDAMDAKLIATARILGLLSKAFEVVGNVLVQYGPKILAMVAA